MERTATRRHVGEWHTRHVALLPDEIVLRSTGAVDIAIEWLGSSWPGVLYLTDQRLIFSPWGWLIPQKKEVDRQLIKGVEVREVRVLGLYGRYCVLRVTTSKHKLRFGFLGPLKSQRRRAHEWQVAIEQWINQS